MTSSATGAGGAGGATAAGAGGGTGAAAITVGAVELLPKCWYTTALTNPITPTSASKALVLSQMLLLRGAAVERFFELEAAVVLAVSGPILERERMRESSQSGVSL